MRWLQNTGARGALLQLGAPADFRIVVLENEFIEAIELGCYNRARGRLGSIVAIMLSRCSARSRRERISSRRSSFAVKSRLSKNEQPGGMGTAAAIVWVYGSICCGLGIGSCECMKGRRDSSNVIAMMRVVCNIQTNAISLLTCTPRSVNEPPLTCRATSHSPGCSTFSSVTVATYFDAFQSLRAM